MERIFTFHLWILIQRILNQDIIPHSLSTRVLCTCRDVLFHSIASPHLTWRKPRRQLYEFLLLNDILKSTVTYSEFVLFLDVTIDVYIVQTAEIWLMYWKMYHENRFFIYRTKYRVFLHISENGVFWILWFCYWSARS